MSDATDVPLEVPTIDVAALVAPRDASSLAERRAVGARIAEACERFGFFQIVGHGIDPALRQRLRSTAEAFFTQPDEVKDAVAMRHGGRAWRGWFPVGGELTSGVPDDKEGYYFGTELAPTDPAVLAGLPLHGPNLFPDHPAELAPVVLEWMQRVTEVGRAVLSGMALAFALPEDWFDRWVADPTVLFRIFHYPPPPEELQASWGVAEHTDYGLLTLLVQDDTGGLEVRIDQGSVGQGGVDRTWVDVPPHEDAIVCNLGDMLERVTGGRFRSTPHRVRLPTRDRYSFPLFLDPGWDALVEPLPGFEVTDRARAAAADGRWDGASVLEVSGPYGDYLLGKVAKVFPELFAATVDAVDAVDAAGPGSGLGDVDDDAGR